jgi:hypothetical protein
MAAFSPYGGMYEFAGRSYAWRCYATTRVYETRWSAHAPRDAAPAGRRWIQTGRHPSDRALVWLVDAEVPEFSQILSQVETRPRPEAPPHAPFAGKPAMMESRP